jgi:GNAT superfamily N-acetyltransferase
VTQVEIRFARASDRDALYEVCLLTGDAGEDATGLFDDPRLLGDVYIGPYLALEGTVALVAVEEGDPGGYAVAALDTAAFEERCEREWWPPLRARLPDPPAPRTPDEELMALVHHPPRAPEHVVARFPAHLHIDLVPSLQGRGVGSRLMERLLEVLVERSVPGVHLGVDPRNTGAVHFYGRHGFRVIEADGVGVTMGRRLDGEVGRSPSSADR